MVIFHERKRMQQKSHVTCWSLRCHCRMLLSLIQWHSFVGICPWTCLYSDKCLIIWNILSYDWILFLISCSINKLLIIWLPIWFPYKKIRECVTCKCVLTTHNQYVDPLDPRFALSTFLFAQFSELGHFSFPVLISSHMTMQPVELQRKLAILGAVGLSLK